MITIEKYTCPMHPDVVRDMPGMCPECGMTLIAQKSKVESQKKDTSQSFNKHAGHHTSDFLKKFWVVFALTIPILAYSEVAMKFFPWQAPQFPELPIFIFALGTIVYFYGGWIFLASAYRELRARLPGMMTLIALAITSAYVYSVFATFYGGHTLFWELATLIAVMLLGHYIEMRAVAGAQGALQALAKLLPDTAEVMRGNEAVIVKISELKIGDVVVVKPGSRVPADGKIVEGRSDLNEAIITGESKPVLRQIGGEVIAGSTNGDGGLKVAVTKVGEETFLAGVMRLVANAQASKSRLQMLSDRAAFYLTIVAVVAGVVTFSTWILVDAGIIFATERLVAVLVIACPHALGLAIPLVASISTTMAARNGLLVKNRLALEAARNIDIVLFDKTGTLTRGEFGVSAVIPVSGKTENEVLSFASAVNSLSEHPLAQAIVSESKKRGLVFPSVKNFERIAGMGARGIVDGRAVFVGNEALLLENRVNIPTEQKSRIDILAREGKTVIFVIEDGVFAGSIALADIIREESREAIRTLKALGIRIAMVTGDSPDVAAFVARELGLDEYFAQVLPHQKVEKVKLLQERGAKVAMVGDGVNDAPALMQADLGIAIGAGTNVAIESAGIILVRDDPRDIPKIIRLSQLTYTKMIQNLFWATGYNLVALPIAAGALAFKGIILEPAVAAVFMSLSTVIVAINALLLRRRTL